MFTKTSFQNEAVEQQKFRLDKRTQKNHGEYARNHFLNYQLRHFGMHRQLDEDRGNTIGSVIQNGHDFNDYDYEEDSDVGHNNAHGAGSRFSNNNISPYRGDRYQKRRAYGPPNDPYWRDMWYLVSFIINRLIKKALFVCITFF